MSSSILGADFLRHFGLLTFDNQTVASYLLYNETDFLYNYIISMFSFKFVAVHVIVAGESSRIIWREGVM